LEKNGEAEKQQKSEQEKLVEQLKLQWKQLWSERFNDKVRAEGISAEDYEKLRVQKGTVIHATRDFKPLNFKEILDENQVQNSERHIAPSNQVGGWSKFVKTQITNTPHKRAMPEIKPSKKANNNQPKKGGRGWLHKK
jgi:hypothetical protein